MRASLARIGTGIYSGIDKLSSLVGYLPEALVILMGLVMSFEVIARYVFSKPTHWGQETAVLTALVLSMLGAGWLLREEGHVKVEFVTDILRPRLRSGVHVLASLLGVAYCGAMTWLAWTFAQSALVTREHSQDMGIPMFPVKLILVIGFGLFGLQFLGNAIKAIVRGGKREESGAE